MQINLPQKKKATEKNLPRKGVQGEVWEHSGTTPCITAKITSVTQYTLLFIMTKVAVNYMSNQPS